MVNCVTFDAHHSTTARLDWAIGKDNGPELMARKLIQEMRHTNDRPIIAVGQRLRRFSSDAIAFQTLIPLTKRAEYGTKVDSNWRGKQWETELY